jgi:hypothetical protein
MLRNGPILRAEVPAVYRRSGAGPNCGGLALGLHRIEHIHRLGFMLLCTTAPTAAIIAFGASDWKMLRPMSTPMCSTNLR